MAILLLEQRSSAAHCGKYRDGETHLARTARLSGGIVMEIVIVLLAIFVLLDIAALKGWAPDTRDNRDWNVPNSVPSHSTSTPAAR